MTATTKPNYTIAKFYYEIGNPASILRGTASFLREKGEHDLADRLDAVRDRK